MNPDNPPLNAYDLRGNYPVDVLLTTISIYGDLQYKRWRNSTDTIEGHKLLQNRGSHWTAALKNEKDEWWLHDGKPKPILDIHGYLKKSTTTGAVYMFYKTHQQGHEQENQEGNSEIDVDKGDSSTVPTQDLVRELLSVCNNTVPPTEAQSNDTQPLQQQQPRPHHAP